MERTQGAIELMPVFDRDLSAQHAERLRESLSTQNKEGLQAYLQALFVDTCQDEDARQVGARWVLNIIHDQLFQEGATHGQPG